MILINLHYYISYHLILYILHNFEEKCYFLKHEQSIVFILYSCTVYHIDVYILRDAYVFVCVCGIAGEGTFTPGKCMHYSCIASYLPISALPPPLSFSTYLETHYPLSIPLTLPTLSLHFSHITIS